MNKKYLFILLFAFIILFGVINGSNNVTILEEKNDIKEITKNDKLKIICETFVSGKINFKNPEFYTHDLIQNTYQEGRELLVTGRVKNSIVNKGYACYFNKNEEIVETKILD